MQDITLQVDKEAANAFLHASPKQREKLQLLVSLMLKQQLKDANSPSLLEVIERMGKYAAAQGLTEEKLNKLLQSDD